jgi:hypothetical protein
MKGYAFFAERGEGSALGCKKLALEVFAVDDCLFESAIGRCLSEEFPRGVVKFTSGKHLL